MESDYGTVQYAKDAQNVRAYHKGKCNILTLSLHRHLLKATTKATTKATNSSKVYVALCQ